MDVLRSALGDPKLTYLGYSYGTRIGSTYAEEFPGNVRAMVLDGAVNPASDPIADNIGQMAGFQKAFDAFAQWCAGRPNCPLGQQASDSVKSFLGLVQPLIDKPATALGDRKLSYADAMTALVEALYSEQQWDLLSRGLTELGHGNGRILVALADVYYGRDSSGKYSTMTDAFNAVHCVDDPRVTDRNVLLDAAARIRQVAPIFDDGRPVGAALDVCAFWPVPNTMAPHQPHVDGLPPVVVVSTTGDPATPYQAGVDLAAALHGRLLTYEGTQHTAFLQGNPCVDGAGVRYLVDLTLPGDGSRCSR
jgi:pimeloyl-ACP methyl ester carboxylesterase